MKIILNPDKKEVSRIQEAIKENDGYCPCKISRTEDTRCMCKEFREQKEGYCHCGLYRKVKEKKYDNF